MASPSSLANLHCPSGLVALSYRAADHAVIAFAGHLQPGNFPVFSDQLVAGFKDGNQHLVLNLHLVRSMHPLALDVLEVALYTGRPARIGQSRPPVPSPPLGQCSSHSPCADC